MTGLLTPYRMAPPAPVIHPATDRRVAILGTSLVQHNTRASGGSIGHWARGWMTWAQVLEPRVRYDVWLDPADPLGRGFSGANHGVSGESSAEVLARLDRVIRMRPAAVFLDIGTNDVAALPAPAIHEARVIACERLRRAGILVVLLPILARMAAGGTIVWPAGSEMRRKAQWLNQAARHHAEATPGLLFCDWNEPFVDPASANGEPFAGFSDDGTHLSVAGAFAIGRKVAELLRFLLPPGEVAILSAEDRFDAAANPLGNLTPNPLMTGAGGSVGTGATGTVCDLMRVERTGAGSIAATASVLARPGRGQWQRVAFTPGGSAIEVFLVRPAAADIVMPVLPGAWWQASCDVALSAHAGWRGCELRANLYAGATSTMAASVGLEDYELSGTRMPLPKEAWAGTIRTPPFQMAGGADRVRLRLEASLDGGVAGAPTLDVGSLTLRQVPDPRPAWRMT